MARKTFYMKNRQPSNKSYALRMGQLLGPYSVGAIYPCDANTTVMVAGLDEYKTETMEPVRDARLAKYIGVSKLFAPPAYDAKNRYTVPAVRFPGWLYCPRCGRMRHVSVNNTSSSIECDNPECKKQNRHGVPLVPERFIVVCPAGHADDFPIKEWVHHGSSVSDQGHTITRITSGGSATLSDIVYKCSCGAKRSLQGSSYGEGLSSIGYRCRGRQPWLNDFDHSGCGVKASNLRVVQMGGTNVCYADVVSSVLIPDSLDDAARNLVDDNQTVLQQMEQAGVLDSFIKTISAGKADPAAVLLAYKRSKAGESVASSESDYLHEEYLTLMNPQVMQKGMFDGEIIPVEQYDSPYVQDFMSRITLVDTLTVTRALVGFSRLNPEANEGVDFRERRRILSKDRINWTLAIQTKGEGIFIELDKDELEGWRDRPAVKTRFKIMQDHLDDSLKNRNQMPHELNPDYVVIHTLAHLLILGISQVCGYSAASLRERIYCDKYIDDSRSHHDDMHGFLIYTASDSSDGSMGGLVRSGMPGRFEDILQRALEKALWCSGDPVCIESTGQGPDSCNLAACYSCALLPETSCETGNRLLDRGLLVGTLDEVSVGLLGNELRGF